MLPDIRCSLSRSESAIGHEPTLEQKNETDGSTDRPTAQAKAKALTLKDEKECGRPLGIRWRAGKLYILDAYHGLFELDVKKGGGARHVVSFYYPRSLLPRDFCRAPLGTGGVVSVRSTAALRGC